MPFRGAGSTGATLKATINDFGLEKLYFSDNLSGETRLHALSVRIG